MIWGMSLRLGLFMTLVALGCAGPAPTSNEPKTAKDKQLQAMKATGDSDASGNATKWKGWRYTGDRAECRYRVGKRCFKTEKAACDAAACRGSTCEVVGAGPASVSCKAAAKPGAEPAKAAK